MPRAPLFAQPRGAADGNPDHRFLQGTARLTQDHFPPFRVTRDGPVRVRGHPDRLELDHETCIARRERLDHRRAYPFTSPDKPVNCSETLTRGRIQEILSGLPPILAQFSNLKSLTLFSKNKSDALHAAAGTRTLVAAWHAACTSLESVTLVGTTLVHNRCYGWVTLRDLAELLTAREQSLQHRAVELCKREVVVVDEGRRGHGLSPELGVDREGGASVVAITA